MLGLMVLEALVSDESFLALNLAQTLEDVTDTGQMGKRSRMANPPSTAERA